MRAVLLDGSRDLADPTVATRERCEALLREYGVECQTFVLRDIKLAHCGGCFKCWVESPGLCKTHDASHDIARAVIGADLEIYLTPLTFGGYSAQLKKIVDRLICLISPFFQEIEGEIHHRARYRRHPALLAIATLASADAEAEAVFRTLVHRNAINMHAPYDAALPLHGDRPEQHEGRLAAALEQALEFIGKEAA